jgi:hypothetical protein
MALQSKATSAGENSDKDNVRRLLVPVVSSGTGGADPAQETRPTHNKTVSIYPFLPQQLIDTFIIYQIVSHMQPDYVQLGTSTNCPKIALLNCIYSAFLY